MKITLIENDAILTSDDNADSVLASYAFKQSNVISYSMAALQNCSIAKWFRIDEVVCLYIRGLLTYEEAMKKLIDYLPEELKNDPVD